MFRVYLTKREDFPAMNEAYGEFVKENCPSGVLPCRTTVFVELPQEDQLNALLATELHCIKACSQDNDTIIDITESSDSPALCT